jgi:hypothetical protein
MPALLLFAFGFRFQSDLNKPVLFVPLDCKAIPLLWLVSGLLLDLGTPVPCIVLGEIIVQP